MHKAFFGIKRVHLRVVQITQGLLRGRHLTPARFDLMRILELYEEDGMPQAALQYRLGVSAPTVSRMLKSLAKLGFVRSSRLARDRRCKVVKITAVGQNVVENARAALIESGAAVRLALHGVAADRKEAPAALETFQRFLSRLRKAYSDTAPFDNPWKREDLVPLAYSQLVDGRIVFDGAFAF
jgi:DNA-binding MarR family transcriptional regulator